MSNEKKLSEIFSSTLNIKISDVTDDLSYNSIAEWDSIGHMTLVSDIEMGFDVMFDSDDVIDMNSFSKAKEILIKHGVNF